MPTSVSIGFSRLPDPSKAAQQACLQIKNQFQTAETTLVIAFASPEYAVPEAQAVISRTLKPKNLVGSSTGSIILPNGVSNRGIALLAVNSDEMSCGVSAIGDLHLQDPYFIGFDLARRAAQGLYEFHHRELFISFSQGIEKRCSQFIRGAKESLGAVFPILGAISSDDYKYKKLSQFYHDQILTGSSVGLLLGGSFQLSLGCKHGFKPLGKPRTITKTDGCIIHTIDNKPAFEIYEHFLGPDAAGIKNMPLNSYGAVYPLGIYMEDSHQYLLRNIIDILPDGSIVCHEGIPKGAEVHLMISSAEACITSAVEAAKLAKAPMAERQAKLVLVFESMARQKILGIQAFNEIQYIKNVLGNTVPIIGMGSYGEIGPSGALNNVKNIYLNNANILIMTIS